MGIVNPIDGFMVCFAYLSSTPRLSREVIKRLAAYQLHGIDYAPSHGSHVTALIACGCDWTGVSLCLLPVIALLVAIQRL